MVAWILHPTRSTTASFDADLFIMLTLPVVALGHLLHQLRGISSSREISATTAAAVEAPFIIVEVFMNFAVVLFLIAAWKQTIRRSLSIAVAGLTC